MAIPSTVIQQIRHMEVFWDRHGFLGVGAGNWSLRATCGKIQALLGDEAFQYLSESYMTSPFIEELHRGKVNYQRPMPSLTWRLRNKLLVMLSSSLMTRYMNAGSKSTQTRLDGWMKHLFAYL